MRGKKFPHSYKKCFIPLSNRCGISQSTLLGVQHPRWHIARNLALILICNNPSPLLTNIFCFGPLRVVVSLLERGKKFPHPYKELLCSLLQPIWYLTIHPSWGPVSSLAHRSVSASNIICNSLSSSLVDVFCFDMLRVPSASQF